MRILHLSDYALSGAPVRLAQVQQLAGHDSRLVTFDNQQERGGWRRFPQDLIAGDDPALLEDLFRSAEVVHYHNFWRDLKLFERLSWAWEIARTKPSVVQFHSWTRHMFEAQLSEPTLVKLVIAQYHTRIFPECIPVPQGVPLDDPLHRPANVHNDPPVIAYTPSELKRKGWNDKGYEETLPILQRGFRYQLAADRTWPEAMQMKRQCDIAIDEVVTGSYHFTSLEALSQGLATVANLDSLTIDALEAVTGTRQHPWVVANLNTLHGVLRELVSDRGYREAKRKEARAYMENYWNVTAVNRRFEMVYALALEGAGDSAPHRLARMG